MRKVHFKIDTNVKPNDWGSGISTALKSHVSAGAALRSTIAKGSMLFPFTISGLNVVAGQCIQNAMNVCQYFGGSLTTGSPTSE